MFRSFLVSCALLALMLLSGSALAGNILVPAYFYPSYDPALSSWDELAAAAPRAGITAIMNPNNGPGSAVNSDYTAAVTALRAAGGKVIGYVYTSYGARDINQVKADIDTYLSFYPVDGFFLDEMSNLSGQLPYYQTLFQYIKTKNAGFTVVGNPGTTTLESYLAAADTLVTFEGNPSAYSGYVPDSWTARYPAERFAHLIYDAPAAGMSSLLTLASTRNAGNVYVTDDTLPNPWDALPSSWSTEIAASIPSRQLACPGSTTLPALVDCIYAQAPGAGSNGFVVPTTVQMADWRLAVTEMMTGVCTALPATSTLYGIMDRAPFTATDSGRGYCVLKEVRDATNDGIVDRGWGTVITSPTATRQLNIMAPHIKYDLNTHTQGLGVFTGTDSRSFALGGAHRDANSAVSPCNSAYPTSDPTHTTANMMYATTEALNAFYGSVPWNQVQFHGKSATSCTPSDVVLADGVVGGPTPVVQALYSNLLLRNPSWNVTLPAAGYTCLQATETTMGRLLNGSPDACTTDAATPSGKFVHAESSPTFRLASDWVAAIQDTWPLLPSPPASLAATAGAAQVTLNWPAAAGAAGYSVKRSTVSGGPYTTVVSGLTATTWTNTGLTNGTTYYYVVSATTTSGESANSTHASATPPGIPLAPTGLTATAGAAGTKKITLTWKGSLGATTYTVKRGTASAGPFTAIATGLTTTSYASTGLTAGTVYYYVVNATNSSGTSANSAVAKATAR